MIQVPESDGYGCPLFRRRCPHPPPRESAAEMGALRPGQPNLAFSPPLLAYTHPSPHPFPTTFRRARFRCRRRAMMALRDCRAFPRGVRKTGAPQLRRTGDSGQRPSTRQTTRKRRAENWVRGRPMKAEPEARRGAALRRSL